MTAGGEEWRNGQLFKTTEPLFGLVSLWTVLAVAVWVSTETHLHHVDWEKGSPVSVLGSILPESVLASQVLFDLSRWTLWIAAGCWSLRLLVPVSGWVTFGAYTLHASMFWENLPWFRHKFVLPALLLFIHAMWFQCYRREFRAARGALLSARICPAWVPFLGIYSVATFYGLAGVMKIWRGGLEWGDGLSLQLWMYRFGDEDWLLTRWILEHRTVAMVLQSGAMAIECLSFLAVVIPRFRTPRSTLAAMTPTGFDPRTWRGSIDGAHLSPRAASRTERGRALDDGPPAPARPPHGPTALPRVPLRLRAAVSPGQAPRWRTAPARQGASSGAISRWRNDRRPAGSKAGGTP